MKSHTAKKSKNYYVYLLTCTNCAYYTGITSDLDKRVEAHRHKKGAKYTRSFKPVCLVAAWKIFGGRSEAQKVEYYIRQKGRAFKIAISEKPELLEIATRSDLSIRAISVRKTLHEKDNDCMG